MARLGTSLLRAPGRRPDASIRTTLAVIVFFVAMLGSLASGSDLFVGIMVTLLGLGSIAWALTQTPSEMDHTLERSRQPVSRLIARIPGVGAKAAFLVMCVGITVLGIVTIAGA